MAHTLSAGFLSALVLAWVSAQADAADGLAPSPPARGAPAVLATPWPAELPCAQPREIWFDARLDGTLVWSSADGAETRSFVASKSSKKRRAPRAFPTGRLTRLAGVALDDGIVIGVRCLGGTEIMWGPCPDGVCAVRASYLGGGLPKARERTRHWTDEIPGSPWADTAPEVHWSRFLRDIGHKQNGDPGAAREELRFSRAFVTELREMLARACGARRCGPLVREADARLALYLRDRSPTSGHASQRPVDNWNYEWSWTATGGGVPLELSCDDMTESPDVLCDLKLDLGDLSLHYGTLNREVTLYAASETTGTPLGRIFDSETVNRRPTIQIEGRLLNLREPAPTTK